LKPSNPSVVLDRSSNIRHTRLNLSVIDKPLPVVSYEFSDHAGPIPHAPSRLIHRAVQRQPAQPLQIRNPKPVLPREGRPHDRPQLLGVACQGHNRPPVGKARKRNDAVGLDGVTRLVDEDMGEMAALEVRFLEEGSGTASGDEHALGTDLVGVGNDVEACICIVSASGEEKVMRHAKRQCKFGRISLSSGNE
jgi:hypothetical protein